MHAADQSQEQMLDVGQLRVQFLWQQDRFAHQISVQRDAQWQPAVVSVEGSPQEDWPPSPPFQSLHFENRPDGRRLALLIGMAGKSHWSASIEVDADRNCVRFDVACRLRDSHAGWLGSTYHPSPAVGSQQDEPFIELIDGLGPVQVSRQEGQVAVVHAAVASGAPRTVRWGYLVGVPRPTARPQCSTD